MIGPSHFDLIALTAAGALEPAVAIAGSRAGTIGVLNLEFAHEQAQALNAVERLLTQGRGRLGVLVAGHAEELLESILTQAASGLHLVVLTASAPHRLRHLAAAIHGNGLRAFLVASNLEEGEAGQAAGFDAVIAKGHEAGGWVGEETSFVLLQHLVRRISLPLYVQGGVGLHSAAACYVAGAAGAVLDNQLLLTRESLLPDGVKARISAMDGSETGCFGTALDARFRAYVRSDLPSAAELRQLDAACALAEHPVDEMRRSWREALSAKVGWQRLDQQFMPLGQDAAFAASLARQFATVGGVLRGVRDAVATHVAGARRALPLAEGAALAASHGTRFPVVQGPMTRVSDRAEFAAAVAEAGALPFLALALMRGPEIETLLAETRRTLEDRPWGVGILGFVPAELRAEQLEVTRRYRPPFALIAGGRPDQARMLEQDGIPTYLHVPSPGLLEMFLREGARRFVFEGRECGGHVGPRTSFVLWETMVDVLLRNLPAAVDPAGYHVLFAGGVHDDLSAAMVSALAAPLVDKGMRIGVLVGTGYLFTEEAVRCGAITDGFQRAAMACDRTALLESGPGHATRCAPSPFADDFYQEKRRLLRRGLPPEELRYELELLNIGRLRIASKGVERDPLYGQDPTVRKLAPLSADEQWARGMYMIGQVAALRDSVCTLQDLHQNISAGSTERLRSLDSPSNEAEPVPRQAAVAIVGMGCIVPGAADLATFWSNVVNKVDAITEVPASRWDWRQYYDADRTARDKVYSRWGGFIDEVPFDPVAYGMPPNTLRSIEPFQLLALAVVRAALQDAGYLDRPFPRERTSVVLGAGGGGGDLGGGYVVRSSLPNLFGDSAEDLTTHLDGVLPEWTEDSFAGILMNVAAGRVANRFDLGGVNYTVDAACASSLAAIYLAVRDLEAHTSDVAIVGGVDAIQSPFAFLCFSKTQALSPTGRCRTFDAEADGIAISEGVAAVVLKRLDDAERDGDRIYAIIRGVGAASDGRDRSLTAPRPEGQVRALRRAYAQATYSPATVGLIEAHGTGTVAGDQAEVQALSTFFGEAGATVQACAIGSVKSMIGHTKATAGVAGLIRTALALHHAVLPPTLHVTQPNPKAGFPTSPFYVNTEPRPWIQGASDQPRRAGVSAFGFGGTDFHVAMEEYTATFLPESGATAYPWPSELFLWRGRTREELLASLAELAGQLDRGAQPRPVDLAYTLAVQWDQHSAAEAALAIVAESLDDLKEKLRAAQELLRGGSPREHARRGIHFSADPLAQSGRIAFLFPGQGSQYVNMGRDLAMAIPLVRQTYELADRVLAGLLPRPLSQFVFPAPAFGAEEERTQQAALTATDVAQPALGATGLAFFRLLGSLGIEPHMVAGHSYGELAALCAAGSLDEHDLLRLSEARGRFMREGSTDESGTMAAVDAAPEQLRDLPPELDITLANFNAPLQTVISGARQDVERAIAWCAERGLRARRLPVACAFHSPLVAPAQQRLAAMLREVSVRAPRIPVYSNTTGAPYGDDAESVVELLSQHLTSPVQFVREVEAMHQAGARLFVEVGPRGVLTGLVGRILAGQPHLCVALDQPDHPGLSQFLQGLAAIAAEGAPLCAARLFVGRSVRQLALASLDRDTALPRPSPTTWFVDGGRARPSSQKSIGQDAPPIPLRVQVATGATSLPRDGAARPANPPEATTASHAAGRAERTVVAAVAPIPQPLPTGMVSTTNGHIADTAHAVSPGRTMVLHAQKGTVAPVITREAQAAAEPAASNGHPTATANDRSIPAGSSSAPTAPGMAMAHGDGAAAAIEQFQLVMQRFLQTQQAVMLEYLRSRQPAASGYGGALPGRVVQEVTTPLPVAAPVAPAMPATDPVPVARPTVAVAPENGHTSPHPHVNGTAAAGDHTLAADGADGRRAGPDAPAIHRPVAVSAAVVQAAAVGQIETKIAARLDRQQLTDRLLAVVSDRTGYPTEMLALDADLEADLGIDSIKRIEIAGTIVESLTLPAGAAPDMERLAGSRTLAQVVATLEALVQPPPEVEAPRHEPQVDAAAVTAGDRRPFVEELADSGIGRFLVRPVAAPMPDRRAGLSPAGVVVLVDDETGVGERLSAGISKLGHRTIRLLRGDGGAAPPDALVCDLSCVEGVEKAVRDLHERYGAATALVHLPALRARAANGDEGLAGCRRRLAEHLTPLFLLSQALASDLESAANQGGAAVLAATALGGASAADRASTAFDPDQAAIAGFLKTLALEWPSVRVKSVDLSPDMAVDPTDTLLTELLADDGLVEVGYKGRQRLRLEYAASAISAGDGSPPLDESSVLLVTGGARGITAEVAAALAERYRPMLLLVGRTVAPTEPEAAETASLTDPRALRQAILQQRRLAGLPVTPSTVEDAYRRLLREREVHQSLVRLERTGARVVYYACDVTDRTAFGDLIDEIYRSFGRIDGVIHGAGVIEDKLIRDKRLDSFQRVIGTKVDGAMILAEKLRPDRLRFLVLFSSVSARFGNRGQGDYAAANEVLNKLAQQLDQEWPARVVAINWGPWLTTGMVSPEVQRQFAQRGVTLIPVAVGCRMLDQELRGGRKGQAEVLIGGMHAPADAGQETASPPVPISSPPLITTEVSHLPLLGADTVLTHESDGGLDAVRVLRTSHDLYLLDHRLDGRPVLPFTVAMELMAETAAAARPDLDVVEIHDIRLLRGVQVDDELALRVSVRPRQPSARLVLDAATTSVDVAIYSATDPGRPHYQAVVDLSARGAAQARHGWPWDASDTQQFDPRGSMALSVEDAYRDWLFHGPLFQRIVSVEALDRTGIRATLRASTPAECLAGGPAGTWLFDPLLADAAFQAQLLWARSQWDVTTLPASVQRFRRKLPSADTSASGLVRYELRVRPETQAPISRIDHLFFGPDGQCFAAMIDATGTGSKALNRLAGKLRG